METEQIQNIKNLLQKVSAISKKYEEIARITGENFNIFKIMNMQSDEVNLHSSFIAELLNPSGSHGQGDVFLKLFTEQFEIKNFNTENAKAEAEKYIGEINEDYTEGGRIDIIIEDNKGKKIIIENKIYADDQKNQLLRYYNYDTDAFIFYLTLYGEEPGDYSIGNGNLKMEDVKLLSYSNDIKTWLEKCKKEAVNQPVLRETIAQYINLIKNLTGQTMNDKMENEIINTISENKELIIASYEVSGIFNQLLAETELLFWQDLERKIEENSDYEILGLQKYNLDKVYDYYNKSRSKDPFYGIMFSLKNENNIDICFFIERSPDAVDIGITAVRNKETRNINDEDVFNNLAEKISSVSVPDSHNTWWLGNMRYSQSINFGRNANKETQYLLNGEFRNTYINKLWKEITEYINKCSNLTNNFSINNL